MVSSTRENRVGYPFFSFVSLESTVIGQSKEFVRKRKFFSLSDNTIFEVSSLLEAVGDGTITVGGVLKE